MFLILAVCLINAMIYNGSSVFVTLTEKCFRSSITGCQFNTRFQQCSKSANVIYKVTCLCGKQYLDKASSSLRKCFNLVLVQPEQKKFECLPVPALYLTTCSCRLALAEMMQIVACSVAAEVQSHAQNIWIFSDVFLI